MSVSEDDFKSNIPDDISYSNADIGLYVYGDFPRALTMLAKMFILAPVGAALLLNEAGLPIGITSIFGIMIWAVYLVGIAQIVMKFSTKEND